MAKKEAGRSSPKRADGRRRSTLRQQTSAESQHSQTTATGEEHALVLFGEVLALPPGSRPPLPLALPLSLAVSVPFSVSIVAEVAEALRDGVAGRSIAVAVAAVRGPAWRSARSCSHGAAAASRQPALEPLGPARRLALASARTWLAPAALFLATVAVLASPISIGGTMEGRGPNRVL